MNIFENIFMYILLGVGFALFCILVFSIIKEIIEMHNEYEISVMKSIMEVGILKLLMCVVGFFGISFLFYIITFTGKEFQRKTICNVEVNNDNTLYKYKVTKYDEIEYRDKQLNGEWKEGIQTVLQYARTHDNILKIGDTASKNLQYYWTEENLKEYIEYAKTVKRGKKVGSVTNTTNLDTLYHRAERYLKSNNIEGYNQTRKLIEEIRQQKKTKRN